MILRERKRRQKFPILQFLNVTPNGFNARWSKSPLCQGIVGTDWCQGKKTRQGFGQAATPAESRVFFSPATVCWEFVCTPSALISTFADADLLCQPVRGTDRRLCSIAPETKISYPGSGSELATDGAWVNLGDVFLQPSIPLSLTIRAIRRCLYLKCFTLAAASTKQKHPFPAGLLSIGPSEVRVWIAFGLVPR